MPVLPVQRSLGVARRKRAASPQPSSADVQTISPSIARDPGITVPTIQVPSGAFESPLGVAAGELTPVLEEHAVRLQKAAIKQQSREDTVAVSASTRDLRGQIDRLLVDFTSEKDLSLPSDANEYGAALEALVQESLNNYTGSEDGRAKLEVKANSLQAEAIGKASGLSVTIGNQKVLDEIKIESDILVEGVSLNPSLQNIERSFIAGDDIVDDFSGALGVDVELQQKAVLRERIATNSLDALINNGKIEQADALFGNSSVVNALSPEKQRSFRNKINDSRTSRDKLIDEAAQVELILGRPMTKDEQLRFLKIAPSSQKTTEKEKEFNNLVGRGLSDDVANDIVNGNVKVIGPDAFGQFFTVNIVTNEKSLLSDADTDVITEAIKGQPEDQEDEPEQQTVSLEEAVGEGVGMFANIRENISNVVGPFVEGALFVETTDAKEQIKIFNQSVKSALINNKKFPIAEQQMVAKLLPDPEVFFKDPDTARSDLKKMEEQLVILKKGKEKQIARKDITDKRRVLLADQISRIDEVLDLMKSPEEDTGTKVGDIRIDAQGNRAEFTGGDDLDPANWKEIK